MKAIHYYALCSTLLIAWFILLYLKQDVYAGMFIGSFFTTLKTIPVFENSDIWSRLDKEIDADIKEFKSKLL